MLTSMREAIASGFWRWVLIVLMSILIVSFAIWGIGDIFRGFGRETVARVGNVEITAERFRTEYDRARQAMSRQLGRALNAEQARTMGLDRDLLRRLLTEAVLDDRARDLVLGISDAEIARMITEDPQFFGGGATFNRQFFMRLLQDNQLTEPAFVQMVRTQTLRRQIADALTGSMWAPGVYDQMLHRFNTERRTVDYLILPLDRFGGTAAPTEEQLVDYFGLVRASFRTAEIRRVDVLVITPQILAPTIEVSDQDARTIYDNNQQRFGAPERRRIQRIAFPDRAAAEAAHARIAADQATFDQIAEELTLPATELELGFFTQAEVLDPAIRAAAFGLEVGTPSAVVDGRFGPVIVRVSEVSAASQRPFEEVRDEIKRDLAVERARRQVLDVHDRIEEARAGGSRLAEIAATMRLPIVSVPAIDRNGRDPAGAEVQGLVGGRTTIDAIFTTQVNTDAEGVQLRQEGGYVWVDVKEVTAERDRTLDEVRADVTQRWISEQQRGTLQNRANEMIAQLRGGQTLAQIAEAAGLEARQTQAFTRTQTIPDYSRLGVDEVFRTAQGQPGTAVHENGNDRIVFVVTSSETPPYSADAADSQIAERLAADLANDLLTQYVARLERDLDSRVNQAVINRIINPTTGN